MFRRLAGRSGRQGRQRSCRIRFQRSLAKSRAVRHSLLWHLFSYYCPRELNILDPGELRQDSPAQDGQSGCRIEIGLGWVGYPLHLPAALDGCAQ